MSADASSVQATLATLNDQAMAIEFASISQRVRKRRLVLYFGRETFSDNTKYLYLSDLARERNYEVIWCSFSSQVINSLTARGLPCLDLAQNIDRTIDLLLHASVAVFSVNANESLRGAYALNACLAGAKKVQLWHGISVKHLVLELIPHLTLRNSEIRRPFYMASQTDYVLSTASFFDRYWSGVFGCRNLVRAGFPRNEVLLRPIKPFDTIGCEYDMDLDMAMNARRKNVLVLPTWQRGQETYLMTPRFLSTLTAIAQRESINFVLKMHPMYKLVGADTIRQGEGFTFIDAGVDVYPLLHRFDALVTDYSSIMFDFLLTGKPVMTLDLSNQQHQNFEPDFSLVPDLPYRHVFTPDTFIEQLGKALYRDELGPQRQIMASTIFETDPTQASNQLLSFIDRLVDDREISDGEFTVHG